MFILLGLSITLPEFCASKENTKVALWRGHFGGNKKPSGFIILVSGAVTRSSPLWTGGLPVSRKAQTPKSYFCSWVRVLSSIWRALQNREW